MRLIIVSGQSGAGKTVALRVLEDLGYYCVDNLPIIYWTSLLNPSNQVNKMWRLVLIFVTYPQT